MTSKRILVVDDALMDRMKLAMALKALGHDVEECPSGEDALTAVRDGEFDLIMLDLLMPGMDGHAVLAALKADDATRKLPVVIVSSTDDSDDLARVQALGAAAHLPKPFTPDTLAAVLSQTL